jgi:hypothetical protein
VSEAARITEIRQLKPVKWATIERRVGRFREGFVATFRKYEGCLTDELDARGRVYVTQASFARHFGIAKATFNDWLDPPIRTDTVQIESGAGEPTEPPAPKCKHCPIHCQEA